jgi:hypothetical protein
MTVTERLTELRSELVALEREIELCHRARLRPRAIRLSLIASARRSEIRALLGNSEADLQRRAR